MDLSIIIVNFNTGQFLKKCLVSIYKSLEKSKLSFDVTVVDNDSTDESVKTVKNKFPQVQLIENQKNLGFSKANNQGIKIARGEYILFLNPDTIVPKETLPLMVKFMKENRDIGIATCRVELPSGKLDDACHRGFPTPWNAFCHFLGLGKLFPKSNYFNGYHLGYQNIDKTHEINACAGAFLLIRRQVGEGVGWFDEDYFWYGEDLDLCFRVKKAGWKIMFVPQVKIIHYKGIASGIKENSFLVSKASQETKILATKARFDVMRIFYHKHYQDKYSRLIRWLVLGVIEIKRRAALLQI